GFGASIGKNAPRHSRMPIFNAISHIQAAPRKITAPTPAPHTTPAALGIAWAVNHAAAPAAAASAERMRPERVNGAAIGAKIGGATATPAMTTTRLAR